MERAYSPSASRNSRARSLSARPVHLPAVDSHYNRPLAGFRERVVTAFGFSRGPSDFLVQRNNVADPGICRDLTPEQRLSEPIPLPHRAPINSPAPHSRALILTPRVAQNDCIKYTRLRMIPASIGHRRLKALSWRHGLIRAHNGQLSLTDPPAPAPKPPS